MSVEIVHFPDHPENRQHCLVWTRKDGTQVRFHCSTKEDCERVLPLYKDRARVADENGWENM